jgi:hypothetical protein
VITKTKFRLYTMQEVVDMMSEASLEVCMAVWLRTSFLWDKMPRHSVRGCRFFGGAYCFHLQGSRGLGPL